MTNKEQHQLNKELLQAIREIRNIKEIEDIIEAGADVNAVDIDQKTPLIIACLNNNTKQIEYLLQSGADVDLMDKTGKTAYDYATGGQALIASYMEKKATKIYIEQRKENIKKSRQVRKRLEKQNPVERVSDVALADEIARDVISGKETRTITPDVGMAIKRKKAFEK